MHSQQGFQKKKKMLLPFHFGLSLRLQRGCDTCSRNAAQDPSCAALQALVMFGVSSVNLLTFCCLETNARILQSSIMNLIKWFSRSQCACVALYFR